MGKVQVIGSGQTAEVQQIECTAFKMLGGLSSAFELKNLITSSPALSGATGTITGALPLGAIILAVDTTVTTALVTATGYAVGPGDASDANKWGDISGSAVGTKSNMANYTTGTIAAPYFAATGSTANLTLTASGGSFAGGVIQSSVWYLQSTAPRTL